MTHCSQTVWPGHREAGPEAIPGETTPGGTVQWRFWHLQARGTGRKTWEGPPGGHLAKAAVIFMEKGSSLKPAESGEGEQGWPLVSAQRGWERALCLLRACGGSAGQVEVTCSSGSTSDSDNNRCVGGLEVWVQS